MDALARSLTAKQFMEWEHYAALEPFSELRDDYRIASIVQMLANVNRGSKQKAYQLQDFLLKFGEQEEQQGNTREMQIAAIRAVAMAYSVPAKDLE